MTTWEEKYKVAAQALVAIANPVADVEENMAEDEFLNANAERVLETFPHAKSLADAAIAKLQSMGEVGPDEYTQEREAQNTIRVEKMLCRLLNREWTTDVISIVFLVDLLEEKLKDDAEKAALWDALMSCDRMRLMGHTNDFNHFGAEFWVEHMPHDDPFYKDRPGLLGDVIEDTLRTKQVIRSFAERYIAQKKGRT